ncbi:MAG TPA: fasciclin domain-containing protein [Isosphaeraceae bacterium]|nr:fasciclin domain-containing protein [Isosphaeraceae bacterium]
MRTMLSLAAVIAFSTPAFAADKNIVEIAASNPDFSTLVAAVKAAGLVDTLSGEGPFTVLAPTNAAFDKLPPGTVETLLKPENKDKLAAILKYHVIPGDVKAAQVVKLSGKSVDTACPESALKVMVNDGKVMFSGKNKATVVKPDIEASNGVIHVIDTVLLPPDA